MVTRTRCRRGLRRAGIAGGALAAGAALAMLPGAPALATGASTVVNACPGTLTWTFSAPLTLGFTASGTVTQSWGFGSICAAAGADVSDQVQFPLPDDEWTEVLPTPFTGTAGYSGSCVVANAGISSLGVPAENGLLIGGMVLVSPPFSDFPGHEVSEVDVLATTNPCNETSATGVGNDVSTFIVAN